MKPAEKLFTCPACGQGNFTHRGLVAHRTSKRCTQSPMSRPSKENSKAIVILTDASLQPAKDNLGQLKSEITEHLGAIPLLESEAAVRAIFAGIGLWKLKEAVGHGNFETAKAQMLPSGKHLPSKKTCNYYMRLARVFVEKVRGINKGPLISVMKGQLEMDVVTSTDDGRAFMQGLKDFVGGLSLNELLNKHGIKDDPALGGKREKLEDSEVAAPSAGPDHVTVLNEISDAISALERLLIKENRMIYLTEQKPAVRGIVDALKDLTRETEKAAKHILG